MNILGVQAVLVIAFFLVWAISVGAKKASYIDVFWGLAIVIAALASTPLFSPTQPRTGWLLILTIVWGLRLSIYVAWRNWGEPEDRRYAEMRKYHGEKFWWVSLFSVFLLQSILAGIVSLPIQVGMLENSPGPFGPLDYIGIALWSVGMFFEAVGDFQLARFKAEPKNHGKVMDQGLWRYTRHPNYFGECCVWWGIYFIAAASGAAWTIVSPLLMTFLLLKVSGVRLLEDSIGDRRPDYAEYQRRTSSFFPRPPKAA